MSNNDFAFVLEPLGVDVVPGSCAAPVTGPPCAIAALVIIALIINPSEVPGW